ncbi:MAG: hypothetical protein EAZ42_06500 [Verrucomicrobia bacterium]|nr:MAG: hypothetical protein EAZ42_06500 [Verrucomicrobiota bacterium]
MSWVLWVFCLKPQIAKEFLAAHSAEGGKQFCLLHRGRIKLYLGFKLPSDLLIRVFGQAIK